MIELLMVILLVAVLGSVALPQFLDFRREGKIAALRQELSTLRVGLKNQTQQVLLKCGKDLTWIGSPSYVTLHYAILIGAETNDVTRNDTVCTAAQIPDPAARKFWNLSESERAHIYTGGVDQGTLIYFVPANPFRDINYSPTGSIWVTVDNSTVISLGSHCAVTDSIIAGGSAYHWISNRTTGEIWPGTNTPGINECNF
jgi:type II secretory pathway pseudopilin PulG